MVLMGVSSMALASLKAPPDWTPAAPAPDSRGIPTQDGRL
jgi:hypothetical protein